MLRAWRQRAMMLPAGAVFLLLFALPLGFFAIVSFWQLKRYKLVPDFTFENYQDVVEQYLSAVVFTFCIALIIALLTTVLAFMIAYYVRFRAGRFGPIIIFITLTTLFGGYLVKIYAWKTVLGGQGILNALLLGMGVIDEPLAWLLYTPVAVVITLTHFLLPFAVLPIIGALRGIDDVPIYAAHDLGAGNWRVIREIILPQCQHGLFAAFALSFLISAGDYVTPRLVGGPETFMVGNFIESQFINRLNAPIGSALSYTVLAACLLVLVFVRFAMKHLLRAR